MISSNIKAMCLLELLNSSSPDELTTPGHHLPVKLCLQRPGTWSATVLSSSSHDPVFLIPFSCPPPSLILSFSSPYPALLLPYILLIPLLPALPYQVEGRAGIKVRGRTPSPTSFFSPSSKSSFPYSCHHFPARWRVCW